MKMNLLIGVASVALAITSCGSQTDGSPTSLSAGPNSTATTELDTSSTLVATPTSAGPRLSQRGAIVKEIGVPAGVRNSAGDSIFEFTLDSISYLTPDDCSGAAYNDDDLLPGGSFIVLDFTLHTNDLTPKNESYLSGSDIYTAGESGRVNPGAGSNYAAFSCLSGGSGWIAQPLPNATYDNRVVIAITEPSGAVGYEWAGAGGPVTWEWNYQIP